MLTREERVFLLGLARRTIQDKLKGRVSPLPEPPTARLKEPSGAFVTLHKGEDLRGCIGMVQALRPLDQTIQEMAVSAAFQDPRFPPITVNELDAIHIEISVMTPLKRIRSVKEIEVGKHGLMMKNGFRQGLLLPQVASEQGWDLGTFLQHTCMKAGMKGECWRNPDTEIYVFSAEVFSERSLGEEGPPG